MTSLIQIFIITGTANVSVRKCVRIHHEQYVTQFPKEAARRKLSLILLEYPSCSSNSPPTPPPFFPYLVFKEIRAKNVELLKHGCAKFGGARGDVTHYGKKRLMSCYCFGSGLQNHLFCFETYIKR
jgi:hypothetical protein